MFGHMMGGFHGVGLILFLAVAVFLIYRLGRKPQTPTGGLDQRDSLEILKARLAAGEISLAEYDKLKSILLS